MYAKKGTIYLDGLSIESELKISLLGRIRLICGRRIYINVQLDTQKPVGKYQVQTNVLTQCVFPAGLRYRIRQLFLRKAVPVDPECQEASNP